MIFKYLFIIFLCSFSCLFAREPNKQLITWEQFHQDTLDLAHKLKDQGPWDGIVAVTRGGLVPAAIIAHALNIKIIDTICISSYDDETKTKTLKFKILKNMQEKQGKWLIIDDLVDSGDTAQIVKEILPNSLFACVYAKPKGESSSYIISKKIPQDTWIVFPWEKD